MTSDAAELKSVLQSTLQNGSLLRAVLSKPVRKSDHLSQRIDIRPVVIQQKLHYQFTSRIGAQEHHRNFNPEEAVEQAQQLCGLVYADVLLQTAAEEITARHSRKGVCTLKRSPVKSPITAPAADHNRTRQYLIPEGTPVPFLVATGIMSPDGKVRSKHYRKFRQINRYVEFIKDVADQLPSNGPLHIVDFGCGKSYLTFATHHLLTQTIGRTVRMVGLDRRPDVVQTCNDIVEELSLSDLRFEAGDIAAYTPDSHVNLAISLHACDTATDDALAVAVRWQAEAILAVPCCQHELALKLSAERQPLFSEHGILHEKFSSLATDAIRAGLLECAGYQTRVMEFIDTEHTPKNLLIRAIRRGEPQSDSPDRQYWRNLQTFSDQLALPPLRLQQKLEEYGLLNAEHLTDQ